jgi:hypothetical protein
VVRSDTLVFGPTIFCDVSLPAEAPCQKEELRVRSYSLRPMCSGLYPFPRPSCPQQELRAYGAEGTVDRNDFCS